MRWEDPVRGMIPVSEFLPVLESNGIIDLADLSVFAQVCATINRWIETYGKKIQISVNLSASMFNYLYFFKQYRRSMRNTIPLQTVLSSSCWRASCSTRWSE